MRKQVKVKDLFGSRAIGNGYYFKVEHTKETLINWLGCRVVIIDGGTIAVAFATRRVSWLAQPRPGTLRVLSCHHYPYFWRDIPINHESWCIQLLIAISVRRGSGSDPIPNLRQSCHTWALDASAATVQDSIPHKQRGQVRSVCFS